jgi:predicted nucleotidyltransferase
MSSVKSAVLYGTSNSDDHNEKSDLDILLSFDEITPEVLKKVKKVKDRCASLGIEVDFNTHSEKELPRNSGTDFWHNNR